MNRIDIPDENADRVDACPQWRAAPGLIHGMTTRHVLPDPGKLDFFASVRRLRGEALWPSEAIVIGADQVHGTRHRVLREPIDLAHPPRGLRTDPDLRAGEFEATDGLIVTVPGVLIVIRTADCLPLFLLDRNKRIAGLAHCGWRGLLDGLAGRIARGMMQAGTDPAMLEAWIGPHIRPQQYEVGAQLVERFGKTFPDVEISPDGTHLNLASVARHELKLAGLDEKRIFDCGQCTRERTDRYHSYRAAGERAGRMFSFIGFTSIDKG